MNRDAIACGINIALALVGVVVFSMSVFVAIHFIIKLW